MTLQRTQLLLDLEEMKLPDDYLETAKSKLDKSKPWQRLKKGSKAASAHRELSGLARKYLTTTRQKREWHKENPPERDRS